jgi:hypothetical protein
MTILEVKDLAEACGLSVDVGGMDESDLEATVCVAHCHPDGLKDDDGKVDHCNYVMYFEDCPEEGVIPIGDPIRK